MFEALFLLALFGVVYVDIIELLEKCKHPHTDTGQEVHLEHQESFGRLDCQPVENLPFE
jgi:hypothetical protein